MRRRKRVGFGMREWPRWAMKSIAKKTAPGQGQMG
jgi:hypothetical protein